jgi:hypothetical protein
MFNTNESVMEFVPPSVGLYGFQLIVSDGVTNVSSRYVYIQVNPNFGQPNATLTPLPNYTDPPTRLDTQPPVPHWPVSNITLPPFNSFPPVSQPPPPNTTVPPPITILPPPTTQDYLVVFIIVMGMVFLTFMMMGVWRKYSGVNQYRSLDKITYGGTYS